MGGKGCDREGERRGRRGKEESGWEGSGKRINSSSTPLFFCLQPLPYSSSEDASTEEEASDIAQNL